MAESREGGRTSRRLRRAASKGSDEELGMGNQGSSCGLRPEKDVVEVPHSKHGPDSQCERSQVKAASSIAASATLPAIASRLEIQKSPGRYSNEGGRPRRYYPKDVMDQRASNQFFRSCSLQLHFSENGSPLPKKQKTNGTANSATFNDSFISLPLPPQRNSTIMEETGEYDPRVPPLAIEEFENDWWNAHSSSGAPSPAKRRPITDAVLSRGLRAKVRSLGDWLSRGDAPNKRHSLAMGSSLASTSSGLRQSVSFASLKPSLRSLASLGKRKRAPPSLASGAAESTGTVGSLNSLSDGRTPWPIPWIEAIFLPEYPNRGHVTENSFAMLGTIANGAFGKVYRVCLKDQPENVFAMKVQSKSDIISQNSVNQMKDEVSIHEAVGSCAFIAQLYASWQSRSKLFSVVQYATGYGDLYELWRDAGPFSEDVVCIYAAEIALALDFMHSSSVIYRDVKMENIVLDDNGHVQIVDFGLAKWLGLGDRTATICGTLGYMAPEVAAAADGGGYDHGVDWWSLGILLHILLQGKRPFPSASHHTDLTFPEYQPPPTASANMQAFLSRMLDLDPNRRIRNVGQMELEPAFLQVPFERVQAKEVDPEVPVPDDQPDFELHPFDDIPRMRHCVSCNVAEGSYMDTEEELAAFGESFNFTFTEVDYDEDGRFLG